MRESMPTLRLIAPSDHDLRRRIRDLSASAGHSERRILEVLTAVNEAMLNARRHGDLSSERSPIQVLARDERSEVIVEILDSGSGIDTVPPLPDIERTLEKKDSRGGWGLFLMRCFASEVVFARHKTGGNMVRMRFGPTAPATPVGIVILDAGGERSA